MGLSSSLFLAVAMLAAGSSNERVDWEENERADWEEVWRALQLYHSGEATREDVAVALVDHPVGIKLDVANSLSGASQGEAPGEVPCFKLPELEAGGAWAFALALAPSGALDQVLIVALSETPDPLLGPVLERGYGEFIAHSEAARGAQAYALAEALHERSQAQWSGMNLAISSTRLGKHMRAVEVLGALLGGNIAAADRGVLMSRLSLVLLGEGGPIRARRVFGANLSRGMGDSAIVLGLLSLEGGVLARARALFRAALARDPSQSWAARGWGLSMVPR